MSHFTTLSEDGTIVDVYLDCPGEPFSAPKDDTQMLYLIADCPGLPAGCFELDGLANFPKRYRGYDRSSGKLLLYNSEDDDEATCTALTLEADMLKEILEWAILGAKGLPAVGPIGARSRPSLLAASNSC
jgi:hypothetical protein